MKVENILAQKGSDVHSVSETLTMRQAVSVLEQHNIGAVIVLAADGSVRGILSERDVVRHTARSGEAIFSAPISQCMTKNVISCGKEDTVDALMALMSEKRIRHLPVVENGKLCGLISIGDVVKRKLSQSEEEAAALRDYIAMA